MMPISHLEQEQVCADTHRSKQLSQAAPCLPIASNAGGACVQETERTPLVSGPRGNKVVRKKKF